MKKVKEGRTEGMRGKKSSEPGDSQQSELRLAREKAENVARLYTDLYVEIYNFSPAGYFRLDQTGRIIELNINGAKMLARDRSDLISQLLSDFIAIDGRPVFRDFVNRVFENSEKESCEVRIQLPDGSPRFLLIEGIVSEMKDKCLLAAIDITGRKSVETELRESERNFRNLFEHLPIGISMTSINNVINVNAALCRMLGYSKEELQSKKWMDITHPDDILITQKWINTLLNGDSTEVKFEKRFIHKSGRIVNTELSSYLQKDEAGVPQFLMTAIIEIHEKG